MVDIVGQGPGDIALVVNCDCGKEHIVFNIGKMELIIF